MFCLNLFRRSSCRSCSGVGHGSSGSRPGNACYSSKAAPPSRFLRNTPLSGPLSRNIIFGWVGLHHPRGLKPPPSWLSQQPHSQALLVSSAQPLPRPGRRIMKLLSYEPQRFECTRMCPLPAARPPFSPPAAKEPFTTLVDGNSVLCCCAQTAQQANYRTDGPSSEAQALLAPHYVEPFLKLKTLLRGSHGPGLPQPSQRITPPKIREQSTQSYTTNMYICCSVAQTHHGHGLHPAPNVDLWRLWVDRWLIRVVVFAGLLAAETDGICMRFK